MTVLLLGLDPGLAACGWALATYDGRALSDIRVGTITTAPSARRQRTLACEDHVRRGRELADALRYIAGQWDCGRWSPAVAAVCAEAMSHPRHASSAAKLALAWGVIVGALGTLPIAQASPQQVKLVVAGRRDASKADVQAALDLAYGPIDWPRRKADVEHAADALAAVVACLGADVIRAAVGVQRREERGL